MKERNILNVMLGIVIVVLTIWVVMKWINRIQYEKRIDTLTFERDWQYKEKMELQEQYWQLWEMKCDSTYWKRNYLELWERAATKCPEVLTKPKAPRIR